MPEGPEVWILNKAICRYYENNISTSIGKHLIIQSEYNQSNNHTIWSFGLNGKILIDENNKLYKPTEENWIFGQNEMLEQTENIHNKLALSIIDWMNSTTEEINNFVEKLSKVRGKLGPALINQNKISGIGVAWGSEILYRAGVRPDDSANHTNLSKLSNAMIEIREEIKNLYEIELNKYEQTEIKNFIEEWFENLYKIRNMKVYKVGKKITISGRTWWINE
jgi:formamidopyrimidine-DNA glycosylase